MKIYRKGLKPTCFPGRSGQWIPRESLLELRAEIKQWVWGGSLEVEDLWDPLEMGGQDGSRCFAVEIGMRLGDWI